PGRTPPRRPHPLRCHHRTGRKARGAPWLMSDVRTLISYPGAPSTLTPRRTRTPTGPSQLGSYLDPQLSVRFTVKSLVLGAKHSAFRELAVNSPLRREKQLDRRGRLRKPGFNALAGAGKLRRGLAAILVCLAKQPLAVDGVQRPTPQAVEWQTKPRHFLFLV